VDGRPRAVFDDEDPLRRELLPHFLLTSPYFVQDMLYELAVVERGATYSSGFESEYISAEFFRDRVVIKAWAPEDAEEEDIERIEISPDEAKLLLLEWGVILQRREMSGKATGQR
jgi:hypothetical protein